VAKLPGGKMTGNLSVLSVCKNKLDEAIWPFPCLAYYNCIQKLHLSGIFFLATKAKTILNKKAMNGLELSHKLHYTQTSLVILLLGRVLKKSAFYNL